MILDLGPETVASIEAALAASRTLVWNGPLGAFEIAPFDRATARHRPAHRRQAHPGGRHCSPSPAGAIPSRRSRHAGVLGAFSYVSAAGGAFLEWLEGKTLPGVAALEAGNAP